MAKHVIESALTKAAVGLGNADNTSDANKPVSTAQQTALNLKANLAGPTFTGTVTLPSTTNGLTKSNVGLGNVDNTSDANKPISTAVQAALNGKVDSIGPHWMSSRFGRFWYPALANDARPTVAAVGDSITKKFNASSIANSWVGKVRASLQTEHGDGGSGFMGMADFGVTGSTWLSGFWDQYSDIDRVKSNSSTWTLSSSQPFSFQGPGWTMAASSQVGANLEWNGVRGTNVYVTILGLAATSGGGTYTVHIDGVQVGGTFNTINKGVDAPYKQLVTTSAIAGAKKVVVTIASGGVNVFGVQGENTTGVLVNTFARGGMKSSYVDAGTDDGGVWNGGASNPCDLLIFAMGVNDMVDTDPGNFVVSSAQGKFLRKVREGSDCDILFVFQHAGNRDYLGNYHEIIARQKALAEAYDGAYVNMWAKYNNTWGQANLSSYWGSTTTIGVAGSDDLHPGDAGHQLIANEVIPIVNP